MSPLSTPSVAELAVFGGSPAFAEPVHVGRPNLGDRTQLLRRLNDILDRRWLTNNGHYVQQFEREVAARSGARHAIAVCNGDVGLEIAIRALNLHGEVIVPSFTFIATAHALQWQEITPVFADIDPRTHLIDPESVRRLITPRTSGIIGVHLWGQYCDIDALHAIAQEHRLTLMFDAAHAFGCGTSKRLAGAIGAVEVFSFHATKLVNTLEGGAIVTDDDELARKIRLMKNFGFLGYDNVGYVGTNGKMNEFSAAMGLTSLESVDDFIAHNRGNYEQYRRELSDIPGVDLHLYDAAQANNYQYVVAEVDSEQTGISRDLLLDVLWAEGILARRYFYPGCHRMQPYRSYFPNAGLLLPETERVSGRVLVLPTGQAMSPDDVSRVCAVIRCAVANGPEVSQRLDGSSARRHLDVLSR
ncbi:MAG TPA: DegT/DnrJ/EryC1/StrS family aminotransferase [Vicinamibacterales bacterium]